MQIITLGNDLLRQKAEKVEKIDAEIIELAKKMFETLESEQGLGLAGPQIGVNKRIFVTHIQNDDPRVFINPSIIETSAETAKCEEGCLSIPGVYASVVRPEAIKLQAWNEKGKPFTIEAEGLVARVILHEYDHLEGVLFLEHLPQDKREKLIEKYEKGEVTRKKDKRQE
ncbi:MAG: peptide deformylase [Treponema sp.]|jgi:peptide deformylase|nr:peptide deformylase [Treponema sp.]